MSYDSMPQPVAHEAFDRGVEYHEHDRLRLAACGASLDSGTEKIV
jgi:hypothetical protein